MVENGETDAVSSLDTVRRLRRLAVAELSRMYRPEERLFAFRVRRTPDGIISEGLSRRYTAIALIGLAKESDAVVAKVLAGGRLWDVCGRLIAHAARAESLGDVALTLWAAWAVNYPDRQLAWERLVELGPAEKPYPVVAVAWALSALAADQSVPVDGLRQRLARRLISSLEERSALFPHVVGNGGTGARSHVACFADAVYPAYALVRYFELTGDRTALEVATRCIRQLCRQQGRDGQWWWHYDVRTGRVIERYPVYAVHQDAMAPMVLFAVAEASNEDFSAELDRGLAWLARAPELSGGSLIDEEAGVIWRKVARREPRKLSRSVQAAVSRVHAGLRLPGLGLLFRPGAVDFEDRPYHLGWLLHVWSPARVAAWEGRQRSG
jgi:hypothetical protein